MAYIISHKVRTSPRTSSQLHLTPVRDAQTTHAYPFFHWPWQSVPIPFALVGEVGGTGGTITPSNRT